MFFLIIYSDIKLDVDNKCLDEKKEFVEEINSIKNKLFSLFKKIIYFEDLLYSLVVFVELYILWKISKIINDKIVLLIAGNIIIFYSVIEKKYPKFLFRIRMFIKEVIEGILGLFIVLIPKYEDPKKTK